MNVTQISWLYNDIEALDIGSEIVHIQWVKYQPELGNHMTCHQQTVVDAIKWQWVMKFPNSRAKVSHEVKSGGDTGEGAVGFQSIGDGVTCRALVRQIHVVMKRAIVKIELDVMLLLQVIIIFTGITLILSRNLNFLNMGMLGSISRPLDDRP
ncbi:hypothetical protein EDD15DRAFT_2192607 [Pisolithus albus]|nr:hypothetical protein EDD15DRAFT_2192607 [Pisolithus albus]